jgi:hypothetical protein
METSVETSMLILHYDRSFMTVISMILQLMIWTDERVIVRHDNGRLEKTDPTRPEGTGATGTVPSGVHNDV